jgi:predicted O-methyltransferase YrrM
LPLNLPVVPQSQLDVRPIDWSGLTRRFMNDGELEVLIALVRSVSPQRVLEIGCNEGRTVKAVLSNVPGITKYIGVDVPPSYIPAKPVQRREVSAQPGHMALGLSAFELMLRPRGSMDLTGAEIGLCDAVFIDGDHGWKAVLHDTLLAREIVRPGGIIVWHDYHGQGTVDVRDVLETVAKFDRSIPDCDDPDGPGYSTLMHVENTWLAFERR